MRLFHPDARDASHKHRRLYAIYELTFTIIEFTAGMLFLVGSWLFFYRSLEDAAIWCFVIGSACFVIGPSLKLAREVHYAMTGDLDDLAKRAESQ